MPDGVRIQSGILCEGFRLEAHNKLLIFGIYGGDVLVANFPAFLNLAVYVELENIPAGHHEFELQVATSDGTSASVTISAEQLEFGAAAIPSPSFGMQISEPGSLVVKCRLDGGEWMQVLTKTIKPGIVS